MSIPSRVVARAAGLAEMMAFKAGVQLLIEQDATACRLDMDPVLIEQVLLNLMKNAIEAMVEADPSPAHHRAHCSRCCVLARRGGR
jgi:C4-dicarboxylate-specific signal transduction histidine kinase